MAQRKKSPGTSGVGVLKELGFFGGGITPFQQAAQYALSQSPESFDYSELDQKYPTRQVRPMIPTYIQREIDEDMIAEKEREVALKVRQAQLNNYDSQLNEQRAVAEQTLEARPEFASLNPQDENFLQQADQLFIKYPKLESNNEFMNGQFARLLKVHENYKIRTRPKTPEELAELRIKEAQAGIQEANLSEDIEMAQQMPEARQYFLNLDPRSADYEEQRDLGFIKYPSVAGSVLEKGIVARMDRLNEGWAKKNLSPDAVRDKYQKAQKEKFSIQQLRDSGTIDKDEADEYIGMLDQSINEARGQLGMQPIMKTPSFNTPEEAEEAKRNNILKVGDKVIIGGKTYITE
jgi:ArsR family metal-binding transcriptional regulator